MSDGGRATPGLRVGGWGPAPHAGVYAALLLVSTGLLTLEVAFTRLFSLTVWYHLAYLTISVALLGFGAGGAIVASYPSLFARDGDRRLARCLAAAALLTVAALVGLARAPLEMGNITSRPVAFFLGLLGYYVAVGTPFLLAGFAIAVPFAAYPDRMARLYFWDLLGAALGCALVVRLIEPFGVPGVIIAAAALLLAGAGAILLGGGRSGVGVLVVTAAVMTIVLAPTLGSKVAVRVTSSKTYASLPVTPGREDVFSKWTALGRVDAIGWKKPSPVSFWRTWGRGPGLATYPAVGRLTYDGGNGSDIYPFLGQFGMYGLLDRHLLRTPYVVKQAPEVLVIGVGGGIDMINAVKRGARHVTGVELQPETVTLLRDRLRDFTRGFYSRSDVTLLAGEGRHFVRKSRDSYDLIQITAVDTFAAQASGAYVLAESYLYTVEAVTDFLARLRRDGILSMVVGGMLFSDTPPPLATRLALNAYRALERQGVPHPEGHLVVIGAKLGITEMEIVLVKPTPFTPAEVDALEAFAAENRFETLYAPAAYAPGPHVLGEILGPDEERRRQLLAASWFRMDPVYDRNPFFYNVDRWTHLASSKQLEFVFPGSFIGQLVLLLMIGQALLLGLALVLYPLWRTTRDGLRVAGAGVYLAYFLAVGVGFMFIEISFVQSFVLFLGSPTHALSVTIFALLLASSVGSLCSGALGGSERRLRPLSFSLAALILLYNAGLAPLFATFIHLDLWARVLIAVAVQLPIGFVLGMFLPLGIARVARAQPRLVPWAWGVNGLGSVIGSTLAVVLAMTWGFGMVACAAAALYVTGTALLLRVDG